MWTPAQRKYAQSIKGIEARKRFLQSEKGKALKAKYLAKRKAKLQELKKEKNVVEKPETVKNIVKEKAPKITKSLLINKSI